MVKSSTSVSGAGAAQASTRAGAASASCAGSAQAWLSTSLCSNAAARPLGPLFEHTRGTISALGSCCTVSSREHTRGTISALVGSTSTAAAAARSDHPPSDPASLCGAASGAAAARSDHPPSDPASLCEAARADQPHDESSSAGIPPPWHARATEDDGSSRSGYRALGICIDMYEYVEDGYFKYACIHVWTGVIANDMFEVWGEFETWQDMCCCKLYV